MLNYNENEIQRARREDLMRVAEQSRYASEVQQAEQDQPFYAAPLARLGDVMVEVGSRLQHRYGELVEEVQQVSVEAAQRSTTPKVSKIA